MKAIVAQGDVLLVEIKDLPVDAKVRESRVIALGETSGHRHEVTKGCDVFEDEIGTMYVQVKTARERIRHLLGKETPTMEHDDIELSPGTYRIELQREWRRKEIIRNAD